MLPYFSLFVWIAEDNELITLEMIHLYVEVLDRYFGNVCELDIIFNFHKASSLHPRRDLRRRRALRVVEEGGLSVCAQMDELMEEREEDKAASGSSGRVRK